MRHPSKPDRLMPALPEWEIFQGHAHLYLVGPGPDAMRKCGGSPASKQEIGLAWKALAILNNRHREAAVGVEEILTALLECGYKEEI